MHCPKKAFGKSRWNFTILNYHIRRASSSCSFAHSVRIPGTHWIGERVSLRAGLDPMLGNETVDIQTVLRIRILSSRVLSSSRAKHDLQKTSSTCLVSWPPPTFLSADGGLTTQRPSSTVHIASVPNCIGNSSRAGSINTYFHNKFH